jgi:tRNA dimethylallyltransferase
MQIYRGMDIGTAKPNKEEQQGVPHHMLDVADPSEPYSAAQYAAGASACIEDILSRGRLPIICGGTGLYLDVLLSGIHESGEHDEIYREELAGRIKHEGLPPLHAELACVDPESASRISPNDGRRIIRALEVYRTTGMPLSKHHELSKLLPARYDALLLGIRFGDRTVLYEQIDKRADRMMAAGLFAEVRTVLEQIPPPCHTAMQAIGYKEFAAVLRGEISIETAVSQIKQSSRRLAKRQMTWFKKTPDIHWLETSGAGQTPSLFEQALQTIAAFGCKQSGSRIQKSE